MCEDRLKQYKTMRKKRLVRNGKMDVCAELEKGQVTKRDRGESEKRGAHTMVKRASERKGEK